MSKFFQLSHVWSLVSSRRSRQLPAKQPMKKKNTLKQNKMRRATRVQVQS